jgi:hypothetical protein
MLKKAVITIPVNRRSLIARMQRALAKDGRRLRTDRRGRRTSYLLIDSKRQTLIAADIDLEQLGRELGVLQPYERLEPSE